MSLFDEKKVAPDKPDQQIQDGTPRHKTHYNLPLIIRREYKARVQQPSFLIISIILMLIVIVAASIPTILQAMTSKAQTQVVVVNTAGKIAGFSDQALLQFINTQLNAGYDTVSGQRAHFAVHSGSVGGIDALRQQVRDSKISILLQIARDPSYKLSFTYYTNETLAQNTNMTQIQTLATQLHVRDVLSRMSVEKKQTDALFNPPTFNAVSTVQEQSGRSLLESNVAIVVSILAIALLLIFIQQYSNIVAAGVAEEKGSRIMEILINATTPLQLLFGKIIGVGLVGITQVGLFSIVGGVALLAQNPLKKALHLDAGSGFTLDITGISLNMLALLLLYFILGFLLYATLYAAAGALVSRQEEVASSAAPLSFLVMAGYLISFYATMTPKAAWVLPMSYVPFFTPMMMLAREGIMPLPWWEVVLSCIVMIVTILIFGWLAAYIYRVGILMYGQKPGFSAFFQYMRATKKKWAQ